MSEIDSKYIELFQRFDIDQSGTVDCNEIVKALQSIGETIDIQQAKQIIEEVDTNGDGVIDFNEWVEVVKKLQSGNTTRLGKALNNKKFFEQEIEKNKPPPKPKKEKVWTPSAQNSGAHTSVGFSKQTKMKSVLPKPSGPPPPKKSLKDLM